MATETEVTSGFDPANSRWDAVGYAVANAVLDPLVALAADGTYKPYLAKALTSNADFTQWTVALRPNVKFSNGETFDAPALKLNLETDRKSSFGSLTLSDITSVEVVDNLNVLVKMATPWSTFPVVLATQTGYPIAPKGLADPGRAKHPIGTGPFILKEWVVGRHFVATKNPNYWRTGLPYLDSVEFRPIVDPAARAASLSGGTADLIQTSDPQTILDFRNDPSVHLIEETSGRVDVNEVMLNTLKPPLDDVRVRLALAYATDRTRYNRIIGLGVTKKATGPFSSDSGYENASGYPDFDRQKAFGLIKQYEKEEGSTDVSFELATTNSPANLAGAQLLADMWSRAGIRARIVQVEQASIVKRSELGSFDAVLWRSFGEPDPDADGLLWGSQYTAQTGSEALNYTRTNDAKIDQDLAAARLAGDPSQRKALYEDISGQLNSDLPYIWTNEVPWGFAGKKSVVDLDAPQSPDGRALRPFQWALAGSFMLTQVWSDGPGTSVARVPEVPVSAGAFRDSSAIDGSKTDFPTAGSAPAVVLTRDDLLLDGGGPLAAHLGGPLLFTPPAKLDAGTRAEIVRVLPKGGTVYLIGGPDALSESVATALRSLGYHAQRVGGQNRGETAAAVARLLAK